MKIKNPFLKDKIIKKVIKEDKFDKINREMHAIGKLDIFGIEVTSVSELFSFIAIVWGILSVILLLALLNKSNLKALIILLIGTNILLYAKIKDPIDKYKESFLKDNELPAVLETLIQGLQIGMPVYSILLYISNNKKGNTADLINLCVTKVNSGMDINKALREVSEKSLNDYFLRMALIIEKTDRSVMNLDKQLEYLQQDMEEERINIKTEHADKLDNALFFPMLIGYFIPLIIMILVPLLRQMTKLQGM